jgi:SAM-dependent methyltransferase
MDETDTHDPAAGHLAPGVPADYYDRIRAFEDSHWWYLGMRRIAIELLRDTVTTKDLRLLDAGCGTGGFLAWASRHWQLASTAGVDVSSAAIAHARKRIPDADLRVGPLRSLPWPDESFDLAVTQDVLQHVAENELEQSVRELLRVLRPGGTLLVRTNGARRLRQEREDWRAFDRVTLVSLLERSGFTVQRATYANFLLSLWGLLHGGSPHAPDEQRDGIPFADPSSVRAAVGGRLLRAEARYLAYRWARLPYGHNLFALATRDEAP